MILNDEILSRWSGQDHPRENLSRLKQVPVKLRGSRGTVRAGKRESELLRQTGRSAQCTLISLVSKKGSGRRVLRGRQERKPDSKQGTHQRQDEYQAPSSNHETRHLEKRKLVLVLSLIRMHLSHFPFHVLVPPPLPIVRLLVRCRLIRVCYDPEM